LARVFVIDANKCMHHRRAIYEQKLREEREERKRERLSMTVALLPCAGVYE